MTRPRFTWAETGGGLALLAFGIFVMVIASGYDFGTPRRMGPGFLPEVTGAAICFLGAVIMFKPERDAPSVGLGNLRAPLLVFASIGVWAALLEPAGLLMSTAALVLISAFAHPKPNWRRILASLITLPPLSVLIFVTGLRLPVDALPKGW